MKPTTIVVHVAFYSGANPAGQTIANAAIIIGSSNYIMPEIGKEFIWQDNVNGGRYRGTVAEAGGQEIIESSTELTVNVQIDCVNSISV